MFSTADEFSRIKHRACHACGGEAVCHRISSQVVFVAYSFTCTSCRRQFDISGVATLLACFIFSPMFLLSGVVMVAMHSSAQLVAFGVGSVLAGIGMSALFVSRVRTARRNPKVRVPRAVAHRKTA